MGTTATASEVQKNFDLWHDKALQEPVQITKYGHETVYLISADTFHELWQSYQRAMSTGELTDEEMNLMRAARTPAEHDYEDPAPVGRSRMIVPQGKRWDDLFQNGPRVSEDFMVERRQPAAEERESL
jgi:antitoxin StbD